MLQEIVKFEQYVEQSMAPSLFLIRVSFNRLLREISAAMEGQLKAGRFRRVLHLRRHESQLAGFTSRLDAASEIGSSTRGELAVNRVELAVDKDPRGHVGYRSARGCARKSNIRLRGEVQRLRTVVLFGLPPVFHGYSESERRCTVTPPLAV
ncbi:hypothetical protein DFH09DRAFT_1108953 [Mycena vulgaris]|nr:hypothetical protein DFH09DRAFT_1108953 [Mycena vulgaris]